MDLDIRLIRLIRLMFMESDIYLQISALQYSFHWVLYVGLMVALYIIKGLYW